MIYTVTADMPGAPAEVKAMTLYNLAAVHMTSADIRKGVDDLHAVLEMNEAPKNVKRMVK